MGLDQENQRHQDVADDDDHDIGGEVVGAVMVKLLATGRAVVRDLEKSAKHAAFAAVRATAKGAALHGLHGGCRAARVV